MATGLVCFEILEYGVYMAALAIVGLGLWFGVFAGRAPVGVTLVPALFGLVVILIVLSMLVVEAPVERFLTARGDRSTGRRQRRWRRVAAVPHSLRSGLTAAIVMVRRRDPSLLGALAGWGFDIAALWASFRAFGHAPPPAVLVMGYYVGTLGNALPLPGGIGGVEGGNDRRVSRVRRQRATDGARGSRLSHDLLLAADRSRCDRLHPTARHGERVALSTGRACRVGAAGRAVRAQSRALLDLPSRTHDRAS